MIGHQHIAVNSATKLGRRLSEPVAIARMVLFGKEDRRAIVAALDQVQRLIWQEVATKPRQPPREHHVPRRVAGSSEKINSDPNPFFFHRNRNRLK
jgi:hypothetical protein